MEKPNLDMVYMAIAALNNNPNACRNEKAAQWLVEVQKSVHAWTLADEILHQDRSMEASYFAAQTMRMKIQTSFHELPLDAHESLKNSLLEHISKVDDFTTAPIIATQLSLALADLALQMPSWSNFTVEVVNRYSNTNLWALLEILTVLPEELENRSVRLGENRRKEVFEQLRYAAPTVNEFLVRYAYKLGDNFRNRILMHMKVFRCFNSWISIRAIPFDNITEHSLVSKAFLLLTDESKPGLESTLHELAADCLCTLLKCLEDNNNQQNLELFLFNNIVRLEIPYHASVANEEGDLSLNYCRVFTELAETFIDKIVSATTGPTNHYSLKILDLVLMCVGHHDYEMADITFNLWYVLSEQLYQRNNNEQTKAFRPYIERLITALCRHCQMEPDQRGLLEEGDDFKDFRVKVAELIRDVVFIVGSSSCFKQMFINLQTPGVTWEQTEASLFIMQAVARNILPSENEVVPKVVEAILNLPQTTHVSVKHTSVLLLGELCEWIERHPDTLDHVLNFLVSCLNEKDVSAASASSLQNICACCHHHMPRHLPVLLQLLQQIDGFSLSNVDVIGLLRGVTAIVSCLPLNDLVVAFRELCFLQLNPLCQLLEGDVQPVKGTKTDPTLWLDRLSAVIKNVNVALKPNEMNPCKPVVQEIWPVLSRTFDKYQTDLRIMEKCSRCVRFSLRCVSQQLTEILEELVRQLIHLYSIYKHSCFLYLGSILVDEYATNSSCVQGLLDMLQAFLEPTFQLLQEENGLRNHPDTVDDFFRLCARFVQRAALPFMEGPALDHILQCSLPACALDHKEANTSVMKFLSDLIGAGMSGKKEPDFEKRQGCVKHVLEKYGQQLVTSLLRACVFNLQTFMLCEVADVLVELVNFDRNVTEKWLANALDTLPKQNNGGILAASPQQLVDVHQSIARSDTSKSITHALKVLTRFYR